MRKTPAAFGTVFRWLDWRALQQSRRFRKSAIYRRAFDKRSASFLLLRDAFVGEVVKLNPEV
jgi:hypothetical protein